MALTAQVKNATRKKIPLSPTLWLSQEIRAGSWGDALGVARLFVHLGCDLEFAFTGHLVVPFAQLFFSCSDA